MNELKKILIIGPIADFGGREVEAVILAKSFVNSYKVCLLSTVHMTPASYALLDHENFSWSNVARRVYKQHLIIRLTSEIAKFLNRRVEKPIKFMGNKITHRLYDFNILYRKSIKDGILENDIVIFCGDFQSKWLKEVVEFSFINKKKFLFRTTGTIYGLTEELKSIFKNNYTILVHSRLNKIPLDRIGGLKNTIIDQTTLIEKELLRVSLNSNKSITYGYLGRFGKEKGILELLQIMKKVKKPIIFAGDGPFKEKVVDFCKNERSSFYLGKLKSEETLTFFNRIDVLIIPSLEEAGPLVGIEAMAAGKMIVSTKVGATQERLENTANQFWFDINNPQSLVDVLYQIEILTREELLRIKTQVRERYLDKYSNVEISSQYNKAVIELLS